MKQWPWVRRATLETVRSEARVWEQSYHAVESQNAGLLELIRRHDDAFEKLDARFVGLLDKYTSLKLAGAVEVPKPEPTAPIVQRVEIPRDELKDLIAEKCGTDSRKRGFMLKALAADRANGVKDDVIRQAIEHGITVEGVPT